MKPRIQGQKPLKHAREQAQQSANVCAALLNADRLDLAQEYAALFGFYRAASETWCRMLGMFSNRLT